MMKPIFFILLLCASASVQAQTGAQQSPFTALPAGGTVSPLRIADQQPLSIPGAIPGERMKKTGAVLTILGGAMLVGGIAVLSTADEMYYSTGTNSNTGSYEEGDPKAAVGFLMIAAGAGMTVPGIIFWTKGSKRYKQYLIDHPQKAVSLHLGGASAGVTYRF